jgi:hypothetical protein
MNAAIVHGEVVVHATKIQMFLGAPKMIHRTFGPRQTKTSTCTSLWFMSANKSLNVISRPFVLPTSMVLFESIGLPTNCCIGTCEVSFLVPHAPYF